MCHQPSDIADAPDPVVLGMIPALKKRLICLKLWSFCFALQSSHGERSAGERENIMLKEEKAFLVVMSIALGAIASSVAIIGRYLPLAHGLLLGLAISLFYPVFIIAMVRFSMALKSWAYGEKSDDWIASGRETARVYLFILFPIVLPVLVIFYVSLGIVNRIFKYKTV